MMSCALAHTPAENLIEADRLRENGQSLEALNLYNQALVGFQEARNYPGVMGVLQGRFITWQHLYNKEEALLYARLAQAEADALDRLANDYALHDRDYIIHFFKGKAHLMLKNYPQAVQEFSQALRLYPTDSPQKGDWIAHLGEALYRSGQQEEGIAQLLQGIDQIQKHATTIESFQLNVWLSGAYLRLANLTQDPAYLAKAEQIISSDPRLVIRKAQLEKLKTHLQK